MIRKLYFVYQIITTFLLHELVTPVASIFCFSYSLKSTLVTPGEGERRILSKSFFFLFSHSPCSCFSFSPSIGGTQSVLFVFRNLAYLRISFSQPLLRNPFNPLCETKSFYSYLTCERDVFFIELVIVKMESFIVRGYRILEGFCCYVCLCLWFFFR